MLPEETDDKESGLESPNPHMLSQVYGGHRHQPTQKEILQKSFEDKVCRLYFKACRYPPKRIKQFPTDEYDYIELDDLDLQYSIKIIDRRFDPAALYERPSQLCELYYDEAVDILVLNHFDSQKKDYGKQKHGGFALASFPNIGFDSIIGTVSVIAGDADAEKIIVGKTEDIFYTLAAAGIIGNF